MKKPTTTREDLNYYFSRVSYNYFDLSMAMVIVFYNSNFIPLSQDEIFKSITSLENKKKLIKSNGEQYNQINHGIGKILKTKKQYFRKKSKSDDEKEDKYTLILNKAIDFWEFHVKEISKFENRMQSPTKSNSIKSLKANYESKTKTIINEFLRKKTYRKAYKIDRESKTDSKELKANHNISKNKNKKSKSNLIKSLNEVMSLSEESNNGNYDEDKNTYISKNNIYEKLPQIEKETLNNIIDNFSDLIEKLEKIKMSLQNLQNTKNEIIFYENKEKSQNEMKNITKYKKIIEKKNIGFSKRQNALYRKSIKNYLETNEKSYEILLDIVFERNLLFDNILIEKEKEKKNIENLFDSLSDFIITNKIQNNEINNVLKNYSKTNIKKNFDMIFKQLDNNQWGHTEKKVIKKNKFKKKFKSKSKENKNKKNDEIKYVKVDKNDNKSFDVPNNIYYYEKYDKEKEENVEHENNESFSFNQENEVQSLNIKHNLNEADETNSVTSNKTANFCNSFSLKAK